MKTKTRQELKGVITIETCLIALDKKEG